MQNSPDTSLTRSVATESLAELLGNISETALDSAIESGTLRDIPVIGTITGLMKAGRDIRSALFLRKVAVFLQEMSQTSLQDRLRFVTQFDSEKKQHEFGQAILMLLDRAEDIAKPRLIAKIISAHIHGNIAYSKAMRLCSIIDKCYTQDLTLLQEFRNGTQGDSTPIAESLLAVGLLSNGGIDGGNADGSESGIVFFINEYGRLLKQYAL